MIIEGELHVVLHPTYFVPCPYLRCWKSNGQLLAAHELQSLIRPKSTFKSTSSSLVDEKHVAKDTDHRIYEFGALLPDPHPQLNSCPWLTLHVCDVASRMQSLLQIEPLSMGKVSGPEYLLTWLACMGPHVGLSLSAKCYLELRELLLVHDSNSTAG
jgi:hypothetical protein